MDYHEHLDYNYGSVDQTVAKTKGLLIIALLVALVADYFDYHLIINKLSKAHLSRVLDF